jgi:hypothetical protein
MALARDPVALLENDADPTLHQFNPAADQVGNH